LENIKYRLSFIKGDEVKYISHLDFVRCFSRAFRRAGLPIAYSSGFNPHMKMVFALPLSVGITSEAEILDVEFKSYVEPKELQDKLNQALPEGIVITKAKTYEGKSNLGEVSAAEYEVSAHFSSDVGVLKAVEDILATDELLMEKKTKKGIKEVNIRPFIQSLLLLHRENNHVRLLMTLKAGSDGGLKPSLVLEAIRRHDKGITVRDFKIHRTKIII